MYFQSIFPMVLKSRFNFRLIDRFLRYCCYILNRNHIWSSIPLPISYTTPPPLHYFSISIEEKFQFRNTGWNSVPWLLKLSRFL